MNLSHWNSYLAQGERAEWMSNDSIKLKKQLSEGWFEKSSPAHHERISGVYILFSSGEVVYIGHSGNVTVRIATHIEEGTKRFDRVTIIPMSKELRFKQEREWILLFRPIYNRESAVNVPPGMFHWQDIATAYDWRPIGVRKRLIQHKVELLYGHLTREEDIVRVFGVPPKPLIQSTVMRTFESV